MVDIEEWREGEGVGGSKISLSSYKMYSNNILNFQESITILNAYTKKTGNLFNAPRICYITSTEQSSFINIENHIHVCMC